MNRKWLLEFVKFLPQGTVSRAWGWLAQRQSPRSAITLLKKTFVRRMGIDLSDSQKDLDEFATLEDLFVRTLKEGARPIDADPLAVVSPVDGLVGATGMVSDNTLLQVKGRCYCLSKLLDAPIEASRYEGGAYCTIYLAPHNYHRVHTPLAGTIREASVIPGCLLPVFSESVENVDELFARNERLITYMDTETAGRMAVIKVGATMVGRIQVTYDESLRTNVSGQGRRVLHYDPATSLQKGDELGAFLLGSTVILLAEAGRVSFDVTSGSLVRVGERIGTILSRTTNSMS